jgi:hypothetical protein
MPRRFAPLAIGLAALLGASCGSSTNKKTTSGATCKIDRDCGTDSLCRGGSCVKTCASPDACTGGLGCVDGGCAACTANEQCAGLYACGVDGACKRTCSKNLDCKAGAHCDGGDCVAGVTVAPECSASQPCPGLYSCLTGGKCATKCTPATVGTDCKKGSQCSTKGECVIQQQPPPGGGGATATCRSDAECPAMFACVQSGSTKSCATTCTTIAQCKPAATCNTSGVCVAQTPIAEGQTCTGTGQGNCAANLLCLDMAGTGDSTCVPSCKPKEAPTGCVAPKVCLSISDDGSVGLCKDPVATGGLCYSSVECATGTEKCIPYWWVSADSVIGVCAEPCMPSEINLDQGSCPTDQFCLPNPAGAVVPQAPAVACDRLYDADPDANCDTANGFYCITVMADDGDPQGKDICANPYPICGKSRLKPYATWSEGMAILAASPDNCLPKNSGGNTGFCGIGNNGSAPVECIQTTDDAGFCAAQCTEVGIYSQEWCGIGYACVRPEKQEDIISGTYQLSDNLRCDADPAGCGDDYLCNAGDGTCVKKCDVANGDADCEGPWNMCAEGFAEGTGVCLDPHSYCQYGE